MPSPPSMAMTPMAAGRVFMVSAELVKNILAVASRDLVLLSLIRAKRGARSVEAMEE